MKQQPTELCCALVCFQTAVLNPVCQASHAPSSISRWSSTHQQCRSERERCESGRDCDDFHALIDSLGFTGTARDEAQVLVIQRYRQPPERPRAGGRSSADDCEAARGGPCSNIRLLLPSPLLVPALCSRKSSPSSLDSSCCVSDEMGEGRGEGGGIN